jgi:hypothetical protein
VSDTLVRVGVSDIEWEGWALAVHVVPELVEGSDLFVVASGLAREFHDTYEAAAGEFGYATREDTRVFDPGSANGRLMVAVCAALIADGVVLVPPGRGLFGSTVGGAAVAAVEVEVPRPSIGRVVVFRSRTGVYDVPAVVTATVDSLVSAGVEAFARSWGEVETWKEYESSQAAGLSEAEYREWAATYPRPVLRGVPPLSSPSHVHLTVLTPGLPGQRGNAQDFVVPPAHGLEPMENAGGSYQEFDVPFAELVDVDVDEWSPGTWRWPERT